jgi:cation diffusion facilitator family transporter
MSGSHSVLAGTDEGIRTIKISVAVLLATAIAQMMVLAFSDSVALLSDTVHNFSNALTAVPLGVAFWLGRRQATKRHTYGYGRAEDLAGIVIVLMILGSAAFAGVEAVDRLLNPRELSNVGWVAAAGVIGFAGNEFVALYRIRVGRRIGSAALVADGLHARTDGLTSLAVFAAALGTLAGFDAADPIAALLISVAILLVLGQAVRHIWPRLMDVVDPQVVTRIEDVVLAVDGVEEVDALRARWIGHRLDAHVDLQLSAALSLVQAHEVCEEVRHRLLHEVQGLGDVAIHASPRATDDINPHETTAHHFPGRPRA